MNKDMEIRIGSTIYRKISAARMSDAERRIALSAMRNADLIVDAGVWIVKKIEQFGERWFLGPSLKH
jgi:hypothetical protein